MPDQLPEIFLLYLLPLWNMVMLLTVNRRSRYKSTVLIASLMLNIAGLVMLYNGSLATDERTHTRALRVLIFFVFLELILVCKWNFRRSGV